MSGQLWTHRLEESKKDTNFWGKGGEREEGGRRGRKLVGDNNHRVNGFVCLQLLIDIMHKHAGCPLPVV